MTFIFRRLFLIIQENDRVAARAHPGTEAHG